MTVVMVIVFGVLVGCLIPVAFEPVGPLRIPKRRSRHQRCLDHIAELERDMGIGLGPGPLERAHQAMDEFPDVFPRTIESSAGVTTFYWSLSDECPFREPEMAKWTR